MAESKSDLSALIVSRGYAKSSITRLKNSCDTFSEQSLETLKAKRDRLIAVFDEYNTLCINILCIEPGNKENIGCVEDDYFYIMAELDKAMQSKSQAETVKPNNHSKTKLPNVVIPKFNGTYSEYNNFINLFNAMIHKDQSLYPIQKFYYLKGFLSDEPHTLVSNLPIEDDSYEKALQLLKERYDNKTKIVHEHIYTLLDLPNITRSTTANLRKLISDAKQHLAALKNLKVPVDNWDSIIVCILMRKLDLLTVRAFQLDRDNKELPKIKDLLGYLEHRALALESTETSMHKPQAPQQRLLTHAVTTQQSSCIYCKSNHRLFQCPAFKLLTSDKRLEFAKANGVCKICLSQHKRKCKFHFKCAECKREHNTLLHGIDTEQAMSNVTLFSNAALPENQVLLPTARVKLISRSGTIIYARALLDSGSQASFVTQTVVDLLGMSPTKTNTSIMGISNVKQAVDKCINLEVHSTVYPFKISVNCHVVKTITSKLPQTHLDVSSITFPANCKLADANFNTPGNVNLLLGADVFFQILLPQPNEDIYASSQSSATLSTAKQPSIVHTTFGHVIAGSSNSISKDSQVVSLFCQNCNSNLSDTMSAFWGTEKVPEIFPERLPEHDYCERLFKETTKLDNQKFQVTIPIKVPLEQVNSELGQSFNSALTRFYNLEKRLQKNPTLLCEYIKFINEYIDLKHGTYHDIGSYDLSKDPVYFAPHHAVIKETSKTTKLRTVFDFSMPTDKRVSLNDLSLNGPVVQKDLFEILLSFRLEKYFFICDIKKMFRCIQLDPSQRSLQNILWRDSPDQDIKCIQLNTVTYGLKSSSYLATRCLIELANRYEFQFPLASLILKENTYVDDILANCQSEQVLIQMQSQLAQLLALGGFQLHKWTSNSLAVLQNVPRESHHFGELDLLKHDLSLKTLGVGFDVQNDVLTIICPEPYKSQRDSKRDILSFISKFYDPIGLIGPILVQAKVIMQRLWAMEMNWDDTPPKDICSMWIDFVKNLQQMTPLTITRCVKPMDAVVTQLIGFSDASSVAFGCCLYLRTIDTQGNVFIELLCSKSRINPLRKQLTVPRLELNAALLLSRLTAKVLNVLSTKTQLHDTYLYSDSQIVLAWLKTDITRLQTYVSNRVRAILEISRNCHWRYVNTVDNPSDCLSRGIQPNELKHHELWWHGPSFLHKRDYKFLSTCDEPINLPEMEDAKNIVCVAAATIDSDLFTKLKKFSNINKMSRILAYIIRFCNNARSKGIRQKGFLSLTELNKALLLIVKHEQSKFYCIEIKCLNLNKPVSGSLKPFSPFLDADGVIRVGGRLENAPIHYSKKHPAILPKESDITELIIRDEHLKLLHAGQRLVLSSLRQRFWIIDGLRTIKKVIYKCVTCFRLKAVANTQLMGSLPADRVTASRPFQKVGVDYAGPVLVKNSRIRKPIIGKGYIVLFVCFVTKAIHIELASDLSTDGFLACFKRFIARRNLPSDVYCDNGSTFKGARNQLDELFRLNASQSHQNEVQAFSIQRGIDFHFIPSYSPIFGGLWESGVKSVKHHLKRIVGKALLTYEQLNTVLTEIEGVLNSRPLTAVTSDPSDFSYLSPGHFLTGAPLNTYPERDQSNTNINLLKFWSITVSMKQNFWKYWSKHYLTLLQNRPKWLNVMPNVAIGSLVILRNDNTPPLQWPMARVTNIFPGKDGKVRAVEVMSSNGHKHNRSITKICVLPIDNK